MTDQKKAFFDFLDFRLSPSNFERWNYEKAYSEAVSCHYEGRCFELPPKASYDGRPHLFSFEVDP